MVPRIRHVTSATAARERSAVGTRDDRFAREQLGRDERLVVGRHVWAEQLREARNPLERVRKRFTLLRLYRCDECAEALDLFIAAYGAEAGNLGLRPG